jgi:hypothetical protein
MVLAKCNPLAALMFHHYFSRSIAVCKLRKDPDFRHSFFALCNLRTYLFYCSAFVAYD